MKETEKKAIEEFEKESERLVKELATLVKNAKDLNAACLILVRSENGIEGMHGTTICGNGRNDHFAELLCEFFEEEDENKVLFEYIKATLSK